MVTPEQQTDQVLPLLQAGADVVIGSRHLPQSVIASPGRCGSSWAAFRKICAAMLRLQVSDVTRVRNDDGGSGAGVVAVRASTAGPLTRNYVARKWGWEIEDNSSIEQR